MHARQTTTETLYIYIGRGTCAHKLTEDDTKQPQMRDERQSRVLSYQGTRVGDPHESCMHFLIRNDVAFTLHRSLDVSDHLL